MLVFWCLMNHGQKANLVDSQLREARDRSPHEAKHKWHRRCDQAAHVQRYRAEKRHGKSESEKGSRTLRRSASARPAVHAWTHCSRCFWEEGHSKQEGSSSFGQRKTPSTRPKPCEYTRHRLVTSQAAALNSDDLHPLMFYKTRDFHTANYWRGAKVPQPQRCSSLGANQTSCLWRSQASGINRQFYA